MVAVRIPRFPGSFRNWLRVAILLTIAAVAWYTVDFGEVWRALTQGSPVYFAIALALGAADRLVMALKWRQLIAAAGAAVPFATLVSAYFQSTFVGHVLPSAVTSEVLRCYLVCRAGLDRSTALFTMATERAVGAAATLALAVAASPFLGVSVSRLTLPAGTITVVFAVIALTGGVAWALRHRLIAPLESMAGRLLPSRPWETGNMRGVLAFNFVLSMAEQLLQAAIVLFVAAALGIANWSPAFFGALVVITSVRRVIAYIESWGLAEGVVIGLYVGMGIDASEAAALAIATYAVLVASVLPGAILLLNRPAAERFPSPGRA